MSLSTSGSTFIQCTYSSLVFWSTSTLGSNEFEVNVSEELVKTPRNCDSQKKRTKGEVFDLIETLNENSFLYQKTGCTHVIGICEDKEIFVEDISRHCAIDKAIGLAIRDGINLSNSFLVSSCRQTASTIRKAIFCKIPIVVSIAAPTDLAIKGANKYGITLIGFASSKRWQYRNQHGEEGPSYLLSQHRHR